MRSRGRLLPESMELSVVFLTPKIKNRDPPLFFPERKLREKHAHGPRIRENLGPAHLALLFVAHSLSHHDHKGVLPHY